MTTCDITFENNRLKVFSTGKLLRGSVHLTLQEEKKVRGVYVRIWGRAYARVRSGKSTYKGKEDYLNEKIYLVGGRNGEIKSTAKLSNNLFFFSRDFIHHAFFFFSFIDSRGDTYTRRILSPI